MSQGRITILESIYYQTPLQDPPIVCETRKGLQVDSKEQPYSRSITLPGGWIKLDIGWIPLDLCKFLIIRNDTLEQGLPSSILLGLLVPELLEDPKKRTMHSLPKKAIEPVPFARVDPGFHLRLDPINLDNFYIQGVILPSTKKPSTTRILPDGIDEPTPQLQQDQMTSHQQVPSYQADPITKIEIRCTIIVLPK